jgi:hypothetical protein
MASYSTPLITAQEIQRWNGIVFNSNLEVNFHHFLYELARDDKYFQSILNSENLTQHEIKTLKESVTLYKNQLGKRHILFSRGEIPQMTNVVLTRQNLDINTSISNAFLSSKQIYLNYFWEKHNLQNKIWTENLIPKLEHYGDSISKKLTFLFQSELVIGNSHRVDVVYKAGLTQGAYTSGRNRQTVINSANEDYQNWYSLEMTFHEISHAISLSRDSKLRRVISSIFKSNGLESGIGIWHPIQFFTIGEVTREVISDQAPNYVPYAMHNNLFEKSWDYENILIQFWNPYIDGKVTMETAVENIAKQLLLQKDKH